MKESTKLTIYWVFIFLSGLSIGLCHSINKVQPRDYQIQIKGDTATLYDGNRKVSVFSYKSTELEQIILMDNE